MSDSLEAHGLQLLCPWDFPGKSTGVGYNAFSRTETEIRSILLFTFLKFVEIPFCYFGFIPLLLLLFFFIPSSGYQEGKGMNHYPEREIDI